MDASISSMELDITNSKSLIPKFDCEAFKKEEMAYDKENLKLIVMNLQQLRQTCRKIDDKLTRLESKRKLEKLQQSTFSDEKKTI
ncbi:hypothetical protein M0804_012743 [Polistes exclamans]|nr:hypothetical protein M0804_012743 [Polistes exclamans]